MTSINYTKARNTLKQACQRYIDHKQAQLSTLVAKSPSHPAFIFYERAFGSDEDPGTGFIEWVSCIYVSLFDGIAELNKKESYCGNGYRYYKQYYPPCREKTAFNLGFHPYSTRDGAPLLLLDRLNLLIGLLHFVMVDENEELDFEQRWNDYKMENDGDDVCLDNDLPSVQIYKALMKLKSLMSFIHTLTKYHPMSTFLLGRLNRSLPTFEMYRKCIAVQELKEILDDATLSDQDAIREMTSQLKNPVTAELLEKNHQSETEYLLKLLSVILVAVVIGVIPTLCLATKRLYDSGGSSINFFKPLSKNLCEDIENVSANIPPANF